jgi:hypothetical protein
MADIIFTKMTDVSEEYTPKPAAKLIPDWYKDMESYRGGIKGPMGFGQSTTATMKRCMPIFDAMTSGYIITTYVDVFVTQRQEIDSETNEPTGKAMPWYEWALFEPLNFHAPYQAPNHYMRDGLSNEAYYPKWMNPWAIKTPPGYSCLFLPPLHRDIPFTILSGVVDTDKYTSPINFPFALNDWGFEGLIPAGTPMAHVIPFKRESWNMSFGNEEDARQGHKELLSIRSRFFDGYKSQYRQTKEYK